MIARDKVLFFCLSVFFSARVVAQDKRTQYPSFLANAYFGVNVGYIHYPFTNAHLEPGFAAESVKIPHVAVRMNLLGYRFNDYLSAEISYMRPVGWVEYNNINGVQGAVYQMLAHGISTGGLFLIVGMLSDRRHTRLIAEYGGLKAVTPQLVAAFLLITLASVALPGMNGFVGEFLILIGAFGSSALDGARIFTRQGRLLPSETM